MSVLIYIFYSNPQDQNITYDQQYSIFETLNKIDNFKIVLKINDNICYYHHIIFYNFFMSTGQLEERNPINDNQLTDLTEGIIVKGLVEKVYDLVGKLKLNDGVVIANTETVSVSVYDLGSVTFMLAFPKVINSGLYMLDMTKAQLEYLKANPEKPVISCALLTSIALAKDTIPSAKNLFRHNFHQAVILTQGGMASLVAPIVAGLFGSEKVKIYNNIDDAVRWVENMTQDL